MKYLFMVDEPWKDTKGNKPDIKGHVLYCIYVSHVIWLHLHMLMNISERETWLK